MTRSRRILVITAAAVIAVLLLGYVLLISPKRSKIATTREDTQAQIEANRKLQAEIARLGEQAKTLPALQARLAAIGQRLPDNPALPSLIRALTEASQTSGMRLESLSPARPAVAALGAPTAGAPAAPATGLLSIDVSLVLEGTYTQFEAFMVELEELQRSMLVSGFTVSVLAAETPTATVSTTPVLAVALTGRVFFAPPVAAAVPAATTSASPSPSASPTGAAR